MADCKEDEGVVGVTETCISFSVIKGNLTFMDFFVSSRYITRYAMYQNNDRRTHLNCNNIQCILEQKVLKRQFEPDLRDQEKWFRAVLTTTEVVQNRNSSRHPVDNELYSFHKDAIPLFRQTLTQLIQMVPAILHVQLKTGPIAEYNILPLGILDLEVVLTKLRRASWCLSGWSASMVMPFKNLTDRFLCNTHL
ncbi:hypothetical protein CAPTEDRAFT_209971 [Capitella teleta]|uniref:Uncharacterized protein n=1 Tax=Capitella teleta TaxID=283909 RepID=R7VEP1_CAPTE|nr:hypothetical protein CAPTEDRAFT_209971 [Capitella teleta]|eukprot:ELU14751.1 hypothetical protein CAPTEDRAFT_209971 [Capitella teleta]